ncbi:hypothetical protein GCM10009863_57790 [Streptomyces axinellae]|uniref:Uncharacterized protein n=1 Tax=Streptomyces axinellae TaxID=552788 RepID=A0ABP6D4W4_9ACTN
MRPGAGLGPWQTEARALWQTPERALLRAAPEPARPPTYPWHPALARTGRQVAASAAHRHDRLARRHPHRSELLEPLPVDEVELLRLPPRPLQPLPRHAHHRHRHRRARKCRCLALGEGSLAPATEAISDCGSRSAATDAPGISVARPPLVRKTFKSPVRSPLLQYDARSPWAKIDMDVCLFSGSE